MSSPPTSNQPLAYMGPNTNTQPQFLEWLRNPDVNDIYPPGTQVINIVDSPRKIFESLGNGQWDIIAGVGGAGVDDLAGDTGTATPSSGTVTVAGGTGIDTSGSGSTLTVAVKEEVATSFNGDSGSTGASSNIISFLGQGGVVTSGSSGGNINILGKGVTTVKGNTGTAVPPTFPTANHNEISIVGSGSISATGSGDTLTIATTSQTNQWMEVASTSVLAGNTNYFVTANGITLTLPASPSDGDSIILQLTAASGQVNVDTAGGDSLFMFGLGSPTTNVKTSAQYESANFVYHANSTTWYAYNFNGTWAVGP